MVWIIEEREGYTDKLVQRIRTKTEKEALDLFHKLVQANKFAGVGGKWRHYYTYPREEKA